MTLDQLAVLVEFGESETLELKTTTGGRREAARTICAMLNQRGGYVMFGVKPDGVIVGQQVSDRTLEELGAEISRIRPAAYPEVMRVNVEGERDVVVVRVKAGEGKPYAYRGQGYRRVGNVTLPMSADEHGRAVLERYHKSERWENQEAEGWSIRDLDEREIRNTISEAVRRKRLDEPERRGTDDLLLGLGLLQGDVVYRAAAVLFGKRERLELDFPQCLLRVARFRGTDRSTFLDNRHFVGNAFELLRAGERFLRQWVPIAGRFDPDRFDRIDEPLYPALATREALANALCHRDYAIFGGSIGLAMYDDRLEITSPGPLHFGLTPEDLFEPHRSRLWNPWIARTFYRRGIIETWGTGTLKMAETATAAGLPRPEIEEQGESVIVRFRHVEPDRQKVRENGENGTDRARASILGLLQRARNGLTRREVLAGMGGSVSERQVRRILEELRDEGLVRVTGTGWSARWERTAPDDPA